MPHLSEEALLAAQQLEYTDLKQSIMQQVNCTLEQHRQHVHTLTYEVQLLNKKTDVVIKF